MNRLVIIGNGFDLAHGLPTSYNDFIVDYWANLNLTNNQDEFILFDAEVDIKGWEIENYSSIRILTENYIKDKFSTSQNILLDGDIRIHIPEQPSHWKNIFSFKNDFFKSINLKNIENWVDIENEYYRELMEIVKSDYTGETRESKIKQAKNLYNEFGDIKRLFEKYLAKVFDKQYDWSVIKKSEIDDILSENTQRQDFLFDKNEIQYFTDTGDFDLNETLLLSFNYTRTVEDYSNSSIGKIGYNYIHGRINVNELPIIFGFGDEMDDNYKVIEDIEDNEYLKNFKSIQYLEHSNYKYLYNFIEAEPYQVFIMGHSCGLSDRTLLSTIFENTNCLSVKVFYHKRNDDSDNYTELVQNISRHFKDKKMLRKKVVEKRHCKPLLDE